jgi:hypothetical protein
VPFQDFFKPPQPLHQHLVKSINEETTNVQQGNDTNNLKGCLFPLYKKFDYKKKIKKKIGDNNSASGEKVVEKKSKKASL